MARRRAARTDDNQKRIVDALRRAGIQVRVLSDVGEGFPDLLARATDGSLKLLECKDGSKPPSKRKLTDAQARFAQTWPTVVVNNETEALRACGINVE